MDDAPGFVPVQAFYVDQNALELRNGKSGMSVVELDGNLNWKFPPSTLRLFETANNVIERGGTPEVLLLQAELLAALRVVVRVKDGRDCFGALLVGDGALVVASVEFLKVKLSARRLAAPQSKVVGGRRIITGNRDIIGHGLDKVATFPAPLGLAVLILPLVGVAIELDVYGDFMAWELPWVEIKPIIRDLDLIAINDLLLEDTIAISQTVAPGRIVA